ncbi:MAG: SLC13/DASS family transporter [Nitrospinae bacterium]|nr:SLC13/DASS family transporter [Nitrospinota bacterium]
MADARAVFLKRISVILAGIAVFAALALMPAPEGMTAEAQRMLAVAALMAVWWIGEGVPIAVAALLPLALFPILGIMPSKETAPHYANHLIFLFLGGFMIALAMEKWNFHKRLALTIISVIGNSLGHIVLGFMVATAFISMWISNTATAMMMLPVAMAVVRQVASQGSLHGKRDPETEKTILYGLGPVLMLAIAYSASIGGIGTLIGTPPNIVFAGFYKKLFPGNPEITFLQWMVLAMPIVVALLPVAWVYLCRFVSTIPLDKIEFGDKDSDIIRKELTALGPMSRAEKFIAVAFASAAFLWIFREPLPIGWLTVPGWSSLFPHPAFLHDATVAMFVGTLLMVVPLDIDEGVEHKGKKEHFVLDWETVESGVPWGVLLLFGGGFALAAGIEKTGLDHWIGRQLAGAGHLPLPAIMLIVCLAVAALTEVTSNTATATMILPIMGSLAEGIGVHPLYLMVPAALSSSFAFMLPVSTPPNAIVFASGWLTVPRMAKAGLALNLIGAFLIAGAVYAIVGAVFLG